MDTLERVRKTVHSLKYPADLEAIPRIRVVAGGKPVAFLRPVPARLDGEARFDARLMSEWSNLHKTAFFTWSDATEQSISTWLADTYATDDVDIMFMIETPDREPFGHMALYNFQAGSQTYEYGRMIRGPKIGPSGGMMLASSSLLLWAVSEMDVRGFFLEVFRDNQKAVSLYERLGFRTAETIPLRRVDTPGCIRWEKIAGGADPEAAPDGYALRMEVTAKQLHARGPG